MISASMFLASVEIKKEEPQAPLFIG